MILQARLKTWQLHNYCVHRYTSWFVNSSDDSFSIIYTDSKDMIFYNISHTRCFIISLHVVIAIVELSDLKCDMQYLSFVTRTAKYGFEQDEGGGTMLRQSDIRCRLFTQRLYSFCCINDYKVVKAAQLSPW